MNAKRRETLGGKYYGQGCDECAGLLWFAFLVEQRPDPDKAYREHEASLVLWLWQRRRAEVEGRRFGEPAPLSAGELKAERMQLAADLLGVVGELGA